MVTTDDVVYEDEEEEEGDGEEEVELVCRVDVARVEVSELVDRTEELD